MNGLYGFEQRASTDREGEFPARLPGARLFAGAEDSVGGAQSALPRRASGDFGKGLALLTPPSREKCGEPGKPLGTRFFRARGVPSEECSLIEELRNLDFRARSKAGLARSFGFSRRLD